MLRGVVGSEAVVVGRPGDFGGNGVSLNIALSESGDAPPDTTLRFERPSATLLTLEANTREQLDSDANCSAGLMHTNMIVLEEPPGDISEDRTKHSDMSCLSVLWWWVGSAIVPMSSARARTQ